MSAPQEGSSKKDKHAADPKSTVFKVTLDVSNVTRSDDSIVSFGREVLRRVYRFAESHGYVITPPFEEETATAQMELQPPRLVHFLDTENDDLKTHAFLLRHRTGVNGEPDLEDLTFKKRNSAVPTKETLAEMKAGADMESKLKVKMQWVSGKDDPAYGLYSQFKKKKLREFAAKFQLPFKEGFPAARLLEAFPVLASANLPPAAHISHRGLAILQREIGLPSLSVDYGGHTMDIAPAIIIWFDNSTDGPAFTGEITWDLEWSVSFGQHHFQKELIFNRMVEHSLEGLVVAETKTAAAYHLMHADASD